MWVRPDLRHRQNKHLPLRQFVHFSKWPGTKLHLIISLFALRRNPFNYVFFLIDNVQRAVKKLHVARDLGASTVLRPRSPGGPVACPGQGQQRPHANYTLISSSINRWQPYGRGGPKARLSKKVRSITSDSPVLKQKYSIINGV